MYVLSLLKGGDFESADGLPVTFDYRLLFSGEIFNSRVLTSDWRKSDATRIILRSPFSLFVCSHPFYDYPQELALKFASPSVTEKHGAVISSFYPDEEISRDIAAILTLLTRRLVTVATKVREIHPRRYEEEPDLFLDLPTPIVNSLERVHWIRKPATVVYGASGPIDITDYNPPAEGADPALLMLKLSLLAASPTAAALVQSARLYALALERIETDIQIAYQLLISSVEAVANEALQGFSPPREELVKIKSTVADLALKDGLTSQQAEELAVEACSGIPWAKRKFVKFLVDNAPPRLWEEDDLFHPPEMLVPKEEELEAVLGAVYEARSGATHHGRAFPGSASFGIGPTIPARLLVEFDPSQPRGGVPPAVWFERLVNFALNDYIERTEPDDA